MYKVLLFKFRRHLCKGSIEDVKLGKWGEKAGLSPSHAFHVRACNAGGNSDRNLKYGLKYCLNSTNEDGSLLEL